jgi:DNA-binding PadR family transcriptional regulator
MGLIEEAAVEGARKPFQITEAGTANLEENAEEADELIERLKDLGASSHSHGASPVWRAMRNLGMALRNRLGRGDVTDETLHELAALIDEFAQRIERIK